VLPHKLEVLAEHCRAVGRDPSEIEISNEIGRRDVERVDELHGLGVTLFTIGLSGPEYDIASVQKWLDWRDSRNSGVAA
jgi:hypothetical protein